MNNLPEKEHSKSIQLCALDTDTDKHNEHVLSINLKFDLNVFCFNISLHWKPKTKQGMFSTLNSVFDPLAFVNLVILESSLVCRSLC